MPKWYFKVNGYLVDTNTGEPIRRISIIATSGVRDGESRHRSCATGPIAITETDGRFSTWYVTEGAEGIPSAPDGMALFLERPDGAWGRLPVGVSASSVVALEENVMTIALGAVAIDPAAFPEPALIASNLAENTVNPRLTSWMRCAAELQSKSKTELLLVPSFSAAAALVAHCPTAMSLPFADDLSHGPLANHFEAEFWVTLRSRYWQTLTAESGAAEMVSLCQECTALLFTAISQCQGLTVWISNNLQDFLLLAFIVSASSTHGADLRDLKVVFVDFDMKSGRRIGSLNEFWPAQLEPWVSQAQALSDVDRGLLQLAWSAVSSADPAYLANVAASIDEGTYGCSSKLAIYLQRYPSVRNGLNAIDEELLAACGTEATKAARIIGEVLGLRGDSGDQIGDLVLFARLLKLGDPALRKPLLNLTGDLQHLRSTQATLTDFGAAVLAGSENAIAVNGIDEQIGGARLRPPGVWCRNMDGALIRQ